MGNMPLGMTVIPRTQLFFTKEEAACEFNKIDTEGIEQTTENDRFSFH